MAVLIFSSMVSKSIIKEHKYYIPHRIKLCQGQTEKDCLIE